MLHAIMYVVCKINARRKVSSIIKKVNKTNLGTQERDDDECSLVFRYD